MAYQIPEDISSYSADELDDALKGAADEFAPLGKLSDDEITDEQVERMEALAAHVSVINSKKEADGAARAERAEKLASIRQSMATKEEDEEEDPAPADEAPADEAPADEAPAEPEVPEVPAVDEVIEEEIPAEGEPAIESEPVIEIPLEDEDEEKEKNAVVASGKTRIADVAKKAPKADETKVPVAAFSLTAAANIPDVEAGTSFANMKEAAKVLSSRIKGMPTGQKGVSNRQGGLIFKTNNATFSQENTRDDMEMLMKASSEYSLEGNSLVAAGGWGAPSEILMDFCELETADGLFESPEVTVTRGGLQYTKGPSFADVLASAQGHWDMTEAVAEAGTELKTSLRPEVPPFTEVRLDAVGTMVEAGLLVRAAWPELVERYAAMALLAHQIRMHTKKLTAIETFTGAAIDITGGFGNAVDVISIVDLVATGERQRYSLGQSATLEVLLPIWTRNAIRADLANRNGVDYLSITDAQIDAYFSARKLRVQFLTHWQDLDLATGGVATRYPAKLEVIMYPAGTYVAAVADVLTLDTVYDSTNLKKNDYVHLFTEQGLAMTNPCNDGRRFTFDLAITGRTGAADITKQFGVAPVVVP